MTESLEQRCIISGIGQSEVGRRMTRGVMALTLDACLEAIADAGLTPADIDGVVSWPGAISRAEGLAPPGPGSSGPGVHAVIDALRLNTNWHYGGPETPGMLGVGHPRMHGCRDRACAATCSSTARSTRRPPGGRAPTASPPIPVASPG